ncbi:MAG: DUF5717 family protein [Firmicutes bacterium]|nr:DUF5717 family protein [Bacillota bacterium]
MQDAVERILEENFNNDLRSLDFSNPVIELSLNEGENYEGSFTIFGPDNEVTEGTISSTRLRMQCLVREFSGPKEEIPFYFDAAGMTEGDTLKGEFRIISNQGEYYIPYSVTIVSRTLESELGSIRNLFHFANLARTSWDEAVNLFYSKEFERVLSGADRQYYSIYKGLSGGAKQEQKVEEFLLEIKKKQKVEFILEESEIRIDNPDDMSESRLVINRNGWGYSELQIEADGDFLVLNKEIIRDEDFLGNCYRLPFYISTEKLHGGRNYGTIRLHNAYVSVETKIIVLNKPVSTRIPGIRRQKKHAIMELMQYYEAFRTKKISSASWMKETSALVEKLVQMDDRDPSFKLFRVQLLITEERYNEAEWLLNQVDAMLAGKFEPTLYCYYLYLTTLLNRQEIYIDEVANQVERIFTQNSDNWRIAWLLLYLSEDYTRSPSRKWIVLEEQFKQGCNSPVLYIEAWNLIAANPTLLMRLDGFELQVLSFAAKRELLTPMVIEQVVYLAQKQRNYIRRLFDILKECYKLVPSDDTLQAICTLLIKGNVTEEFSFPWYEKGIEKELRITRLYEYYMMSLKLKDDCVIPKIVLMYFAFDSNLDSLHNAFLYAYVHRNKEQYPELYASYKEQIERFVVFQILKGKNNKYLAYLYKNLITPVMITEETAQGLVTALFVQHLTVMRSDIRKVILIYEKEREEVVYPIIGREAYIPVYGSSCQLLLEDVKGNRYCRQAEYTLERLLMPDKLASMIAPYVTGCVHFDLWLCERGKELAGVNGENVEYMKRIVQEEQIIESVKREIRMRLIHYFYDNDKMKELDDFLKELTPDQIESDCFTQVVRFMVIRGMYEKAYEWIRLRGGEGIESKLIVRLCSRLLAMEEMGEDDTMLQLAHMAFKAGKYDENLLKYLCSYFKGTSKEMRDIWKAAEAFGLDTYEICERILIQMLYSGAFVGERVEIFKRYIASGAKMELELAFLAQCSFDYFVRDKLTDAFILEEIQRVTERKEELPFVCKLAYTKYYAENKKQVDEVVSRYVIIFLREILSKNKYFPYFKEYADHIPVMRQFMDKTMVEYHVTGGGKAVIHYLIEKDGNAEGEYVKEEMQNMFGGVCVKQFILFFGERLQYYITETEDDKEQLTESGTLSRNDTAREQRESKYSLLNDIAVGRNLHDYDTMEKLLYEYFEKDHIVKEMFHMR